MGAGFWAGFGEQFSETVEDNRKFIREKAEERKNYLQRYGAAAIKNSRKDVDQMKKYVSYFNMRGLSKRSVQGILERGGYQAIQNFYSLLNSRPDLTVSDLKDVASNAEQYASDMEIDPVSIMEKSLGLIKSGVGKDPEERKTNFFQSLFGFEDRPSTDRNYEDYERAIAEEGNVPEGLGGDLSGIMLPAKGTDISPDKIFTELQKEAKSLLDTTKKKAQQASIFNKDAKDISGNPAVFPKTDFYTNIPEAITFSQKLKTLENMSNDRMMTEFALINPSFLMTAHNIETKASGAITQNPFLSNFSKYYNSFKGFFNNMEEFVSWNADKPRDGSLKGKYVVGDKVIMWIGK